MAAIRRLGAQTLPFEKENENVRAMKAGVGKVTRPRVALGDHTNKNLNVLEAKTFGDAKKNLTRAKASTLLATKTPALDMVEVSEALAECAVPNSVKDIDKEDYHNPQLCAEYVNDIMRYLRAMERKYSVSQDYMNNQHEINAKMRVILIDWLVQVHTRFQLLQETLYMTISIIDRYLACNEVSKQKLQLVGVSAMLLASKYEEMYAPEINDFVYITDHAYTKRQIRQMEAQIFKTLDFSLGKPLSLHFLRRNSKAGEVDAEKHTMAKYLMEVTLPDYTSVKFLPSEIAAAALCLALKLIDKSSWTPTLEYYSTYTEGQLKPCMKRIAQLVVTKGKDKAVHTKYAQSKFMRISTYQCLKSSMIEDIAKGD
ncbi:G2/mitotic-specific cyclin-B [Exaiptasia diaphana]|uniref:Cyclin B n=1 Tax=Exaiptasia diaphana TaxID=2652724 RepID=A0A913X3T4_EXADI|nr:G2/mitotic-specific cyclin-B [Exaiptasia diaphana]KXJ27183.1 G2/mitotic-specific cyclin-B [Exaiptasia diaphana]